MKIVRVFSGEWSKIETFSQWGKRNANGQSRRIHNNAATKTKRNLFNMLCAVVHLRPTTKFHAFFHSTNLNAFLYYPEFCPKTKLFFFFFCSVLAQLKTNTFSYEKVGEKKKQNLYKLFHRRNFLLLASLTASAHLQCIGIHTQWARSGRVEIRKKLAHKFQSKCEVKEQNQDESNSMQWTNQFHITLTKWFGWNVELRS